MYDYGIIRRLVRDIPVSYGNARLVCKNEEYKKIVEIIPLFPEQFCSYEQDRMDFNPYYKYSHGYRNVINFYKIPEDCREFVKNYVLNILDRCEKKPSTASAMVRTLGRILQKAEELSFANSFFDIRETDLESAIEGELWPSSLKSVYRAYNEVIRLYDFLVSDYGLCLAVDVETLLRRKLFISDVLRGYDGPAHSPIIPDQMLTKLMTGFDRVMRDEGVPISDRMIMGGALLDTQIGVRVSEIPCIETTCLRSIVNLDGVKDDYLVYNSVKAAGAEQEIIKIKTICTNRAKETIKYLLALRNRIPGIEKNPFLIVQDTEESVSGIVMSSNVFYKRYQTCCARYLSRIVSKSWKGIRKIVVSGKRYSIPPIHSFRVTFATMLFRFGMDPDYIDCILGHRPASNCLDAYVVPSYSSRKKVEIDNYLQEVLKQ